MCEKVKIIEGDKDQEVITGNKKESDFLNYRITEETQPLYRTEDENPPVGDYFDMLINSEPKPEFEDISSYNIPVENDETQILSQITEELKSDEPETVEYETDEEFDETDNSKNIWKNKKKRANFAYSFVTVMLVIVGVAYGFLNAVLDNVQQDDTQKEPEQYVEKVYDEEDFDLYSAIGSASSLNNYVYQWYDTGEPMTSKNVINVLLLGLDSKTGLENGGRSDVMMLVSLNKKTEKITMVSLFRDSWVYFRTPTGSEYYSKMNGSYFYGGAECAVETIEKVFKISIDHYVTVDFSSFQEIVDAVGGVRVDVQEYESKNMMREWRIECPIGEDVLLNGRQALYFARQRHSDIDGDVSRTRRQRQVITAFIESCKGASISQLSDALNKVFEYVRTDLTKTEILNYATRALAGGWLNYDIESVSISDPEVFKTPTIKGTSLVVLDYPVVAKRIQEAVYGNTNIVLDEDRVKVFDLY